MCKDTLLFSSSGFYAGKCIIAICSFLVLMLLPLFFYREIDLLDFVQRSQSKLYVTGDLCDDICNGNVIVTESFFKRFINSNSDKFVAPGKLGNISVIIKIPVMKLNDSLQSDDHAVHGRELYQRSFFLELPEEVYSIFGTKHTKVKICSHINNTDFAHKSIGTVMSNYDNGWSYSYQGLWDLVNVSPEPLILKMLNPEVWPVPKFFGHCGVVYAVEDCGSMLTNLYDADWVIRANISYQLLKYALKFTLDDPDFAFYLTDISPDNIAVNQEGAVKFIDLEDVILVAKSYYGFDGWQFNHTSAHYDCHNCISFEPDEICSHRVSDHNIYAVCKEILSHSDLLPGGLLHSNQHSLDNLYQLIEECIRPKKLNRFETAEKIMLLLKIYT